MTSKLRKIIKDDLCTNCGTCIGLCPKEAIKLTVNEKKGVYLPKINKKICNNCSICYNVCPGHETDYKKLNEQIFGKQPENFFLGNFISCYIGHSNNQNIRYNSSSGGLITQLLILALEKGIINGALVTRMKKENPLEPEPFIARTKEEIIQASTSKYCPVPLNVVLREIIDSKKEDKFAVVGLPCQLNGIRNAESLNKKLENKIILHFGIYCSHTDNFKGTEFLLKKLGIKKEEIIKFDYRGSGWPGEIKIKLNNGNETKIKLNNHLFIWFHNSGLFSPFRCLICNDVTAELSDISFGDAWLPEIISKEKVGKSILITRSKVGEELLKLAISKNFIELSFINHNRVIESQLGLLHYKKINIKERINYIKLLGKKSPKTVRYFEKSSVYNKLSSILSLFNYYLGYKTGNSMNIVPLILFRIYFFAYSFFLLLPIKRDQYLFKKKK